MARFTIYSSDGQTVRYTGTPVYHGTHLKPAYLEFREIASPTPIAWEVGDYVDYSVLDGGGNETRTGYRYKLYSLPQPTKQAASGLAGDAFVYNDVQFHCATKDLEIAPFRDVVISDNTIHFTTLPEVATFEDVYGIARRIQENMDTFFGTGVWSIGVINGLNATNDAELIALLTTVKEFSLSDGKCLDALDLIYSQWRGIGWVYSVENGVNTITIGRPNVQDAGNTTSVFSYGIGNGIKVLRREQSDKNDFATRIYAYGSTRNLVARYYNNLSPAIKDAASVYIPNLMIPPSYWGVTSGARDARKAYLEASPSVVAKYGLRPKVVYFDGSGDYEEIYPSIEGVTTGDLRAAMAATDDYYPSATAYPLGTERIDEVVARVNPSDNGVVGTATGEKYSESVTMVGTGSVSHTEHVWKTSPEIYFELGDLTASAVLSTGGTVKFTPNIHGVIGFANADLGGLTLGVYLVIDGEVYKTFSVPLNKTAHSASIAPEEITCTIEHGGTVVLRGYVEARPLNPADDFDVVFSATAGDTTLNVETTLADSFTVTIRQIGFDIAKQQSSISNGLCTIAFKSGWCAGRDFTVKKVEYDAENDAWVLTVARQSDESIGQYFPNSIYRIEPGDRFVLTDLTMPEVYITSAQVRLYNRASAVLASLSSPKMVYEPEIDAKVLTESPEVITEGMYMPIQDPDIVDGGTEWVLIDSIEIDEGSEAIPTYKITLQDEKRESFFNRITRATSRNTRTIQNLTTDGSRVSVEAPEPDYEVATKASGGTVSSQFFAPVRDEQLNAIVGAKALYDLFIVQSEANPDASPAEPEVLKNITDVLKHLSLHTETVNAGTNEESTVTVLVSDLTFCSTGNIVAGGIGTGGGGTGGGSLATLTDVTITNPAAGNILRYDATTNHWVNMPLSVSLAGLSDVSIGTPSNGQALLYDSANQVWKPGTVSGGGGGEVTVVSNDATIGTSLVALGTINGTAIRAKIGSYLATADYTGNGTNAVNRATADASGNTIKNYYGANLVVANSELLLKNGNNTTISTITGSQIVSVIGNNAVANATNATNATNAVSAQKATNDANGNTIASQTWVTQNFASSQDLNGKANKPTSYTNGNFAALDINGNLKDSGYSDSSFVRSVTVSSEDTTIGTTLTKIATVQGVDIKAKIAEYLLASNFTASNIVNTLGTTPVNRATADENGKAFTTSYLRKDIDDVMAGNLTIGSSSANKTLTIHGSTNAALTIYGGSSSSNVANIYRNATALQIVSDTALTGTLSVSSDTTIAGNATVGAITNANSARQLTIYGTTGAALNIYGVQNGTTRYLSSLYTASDGLHITTATAIGGNLTASGNINATGNIIANGNVVAGSASDRRLKENVKEIQGNEAEDILMALRPVSFVWNNKAKELGGLEGVSRGFIADEFLPRIPGAGRKMWGEYDAIDYIQVIPYLVAAFKRQFWQIRELEQLTRRY